MLISGSVRHPLPRNGTLKKNLAPGPRPPHRPPLDFRHPRPPPIFFLDVGFGDEPNLDVLTLRGGTRFAKKGGCDKNRWGRAYEAV